MISYRDYITRRQTTVWTLDEFKNYLNSHTDEIKFRKMNNVKGVCKILDALLENVDKFMELGEYAEISIKEDKKC